MVSSDFSRSTAAAPPNPETLRAILQTAANCFGANDLDGASEAVTRAQVIAPNESAVCNIHAIILRELGKYPEALEEIEKALEKRPASTLYLNNKSNILRSMRRIEEGRETARIAATLEPGLAEAWLIIGLMDADDAWIGRALSSVERALRIRPDYPEALKAKAIFITNLKQWGDALPVFELALEKMPDDKDLVESYAEALFNLGREDKALTCIEDLVEKQKIHIDDLQRDGGRKKIALQRAQEKLIDLVQTKGQYLLQLGRDAEALAVHDWVAKEMKEKRGFVGPGVQFSRAQCYTFRDPSDTFFQELVALEPLLPELEPSARANGYYCLAKAYQDVGQPEEAIVRYIRGGQTRREELVYHEPTEALETRKMWQFVDSDTLEAHMGKGHESDVPIIILGMPRSGTSLTEQILASHPDVYGAGELGYLGQVFQGLYLRDRLALGGDAPSRKKTLAERGEEYVRKTRMISDPEARHITDKMPTNFHYAGLIPLILPNATIIHTRRNPVDTCVSCLQQNFQPNGLEWSFRLQELGRFYWRYDKLMKHWMKVLPPGRIYESRYEELVGDFEPKARALVDHCGLSWHDNCLEFYKTERAVKTASHSQVKKPIYKTSVAKWRKYEKHLGPLLKALGEELVEESRA